MKTTLLSLVAIASLVVLGAAGGRPAHGTAAQPPEKADPDPRAKDAEPLPEAPKLDAKNDLIPLNREKTFLLEVVPAAKPDEKPKAVRVLLATEVCLREGPLEVFLCKKGTKEHEAVVRVDLDAKLIHAALLATGAKPGAPAQFVNPKTNEPDYKPASGTTIKVSVHYRKDGKLHSHSAREWVWNSMKKKPVETDWVFAGSHEIKDPDRPNDPPFYGANSGEVISVSNFPYSMLDLPIEISKDDANLNFEAKTDRIPPLFSKVWVILEPVPDKK
ncbi:MAG: hypothetical protein JWO38_6050 [Gemmataceae bacterium]|nr:hypothetical protein [Gemmataceae bacterium]